MWSLSDGILRGDGEDLTAAVFEAWTGTPALPGRPRRSLEPSWSSSSNLPPEAEVDQDELNALNPPELWFWHHALDEDELVDRVATALPQYEVEYDEMAQERWRPIVAYPPRRRDRPGVAAAGPAQGRGHRRTGLGRAAAAARVRRPWPRPGPPCLGCARPPLGPPAAGSATGWPQLRAALGPVTPEEVGDGLLFVTARDPRAPQTGATPWVSSDERYAAVVEAARILGEVAVDAVDPL